MQVDGRPMRSLWADAGDDAVCVIDQRQLPHRLVVERLRSVDEVHRAIAGMWVRGAPLIGAAAAYGMALACRADAGDAALRRAAAQLTSARPTAVNLAWAVGRMLARLAPLPTSERADAAWIEAGAVADEDVAVNEAIGRHGFDWLRTVSPRDGRRLNILTHCNAGWLATVDWGTALAPLYRAQAAGVDLHVWVDETRPRNQGAALTAWELGRAGVPHTLVADNAGGHLMQRGQVDAVIVGCDRVAANGDVCNKIGTYLKALAARAHGVPFLVAMPTSTLDLALCDGSAVPIEERAADEVTHLRGAAADGSIVEVRIAPEGCAAANPAFDVTPAALVTGLITERGVCAAEPAALRALAAPAR